MSLIAFFFSRLNLFICKVAKQSSFHTYANNLDDSPIGTTVTVPSLLVKNAWSCSRIATRILAEIGIPYFFSMSLSCWSVSCVPVPSMSLLTSCSYSLNRFAHF